VNGWGSPNSDDWRKSLALGLLCAPQGQNLVHNKTERLLVTRFLSSFILVTPSANKHFSVIVNATNFNQNAMIFHTAICKFLLSFICIVTGVHKGFTGFL
jgi:hypothetical protein